MAPIIYLAQVSLYAAIMWGIYFIVWRNQALHIYSRVYLLASLILPAILPFIHVPVSAPTATAVHSVTLPEISIASAGSLQASAETTWLEMLTWLYVGGSVLFAALHVSAYVRLNKKLRSGSHQKFHDHTIITETGIGPGTFGRRIFFPSAQVDPVIVQHELAHIYSGHRYDSFLLQLLHVVFWVSPAHWLIGRELKTVHEFEADRIASKGIDTADYASLLLSQSFGSSQPFAIAHSFFHHPLKRRIMMLQKMKAPKRLTLLLAALVLTAGFMSTALLAQTEQPVKRISEAELKTAIALLDDDVIKRNTPPKNGEILLLGGGGVVFKRVDQMPAFNGSMREWLLANMHFPDADRVNSIKKSSVVQFTVSEHGQVLRPVLIQSSGDKMLDEEAVRVIGKMPDWKPGRQNGKPAAVLYTLPLSYNKVGDGC